MAYKKTAGSRVNTNGQYSSGEIAATMGMSLGAVANSLQASLAKISRASELLR